MKKRIIAMFLVMITVLVSLAATFSEAYIPSETTTSKIRFTPLIMYSKEQLNVILLVDASKSMQGKRMKQVDEAISDIKNYLLMLSLPV